MTPEEVPDGPVVLDTGVVSCLRSGRSRAGEFEGLLAGHPTVLTFVTVAELLYGAHDKRWGPPNRQRLERWLLGKPVIDVNAGVVAEWALLAHRLKEVGSPLKGGGVNDMWIAASALAQSVPLPVATENLADFERIADVSGLVLVHPDA